MTAIECRREADGGWLRLILNTPPANVITMGVVGELRDCLSPLAADRGLKWITIEGAAAHFSYGASVAEHLPPIVSEMLPAFHALIRDLLEAPAPTAALVRGRCLGGGLELALACDHVFAAADAQLGVPEVSLGVFPPAAAVLLPLRIGTTRAARAVLTGEILPASWWAEAGLIVETAPSAELLDAAGRWFDRHFAPRSSVALRHAAIASRDVLRRLALPSLGALEHHYLDTLLASHDGIEGCEAFVEKRAPVWTNR